MVKTVEKASGLKEVNSLAPDGQSYGSGIKGNHSKRSFMLPVPLPDFPGTGRLYLGLPFLTQFLWSARIPTTCWNCCPASGHGRSPPSFLLPSPHSDSCTIHFWNYSEFCLTVLLISLDDISPVEPQNDDFNLQEREMSQIGSWWWQGVVVRWNIWRSRLKFVF